MQYILKAVNLGFSENTQITIFHCVSTISTISLFIIFILYFKINMVNDWDRKKTNYMLTKLQKRQTITLIFALWNIS